MWMDLIKSPAKWAYVWLKILQTSFQNEVFSDGAGFIARFFPSSVCI